MSAWQTYNTTLTCIVDETEYEIPVWNMNVSSGPYSRSFGDSVAARAFDGRYYSRHQGWRTRATLSWDYLTGDAQEVLRAFIVAALEHGSFRAVFNPELGTQIVEMVIDDANEALVAVFDGNNRFRAVSISFISVNISDVAPNWITIPPLQNFTKMYFCMWGTGSSPNYFIVADRDESNVGSWTYTTHELPIALYTSGINTAGEALLVDESSNIAFIQWNDQIRSFDLDGNLIGFPTPNISGFNTWAIDTDNKKLYILSRSGTVPTYVTTLREYDYEFNFLRVVWTRTTPLVSSDNLMAYGQDGYLYLRTTYSFQPNKFVRIRISTGVLEELSSGWSGANNGGPAACDYGTRTWVAMNTGSNQLWRIDLDSPGSVNVLYGAPEVAITGGGVALDPLDQKIYFAGIQSQIARSNYDGSGMELVIDMPSALSNHIVGISLGR